MAPLYAEETSRSGAVVLFGPGHGRAFNFLAFLNWCVRTDRIAHNPCRNIPKVDETKDQRVRRRSLTTGELARLLDAAGPSTSSRP